MSEQSVFSINQPEELEGLNDAQLSEWLRSLLTNGSDGRTQLLSQSEPHIYVSAIFGRCNPVLQARIASAFAGLLEQFEPSSPTPGARQYLFYLLSLATVIRNAPAGQRIRRWLFTHAFEGWKYEIFDLHNELLISTAAYDTDDVWKNFIIEVLPKRLSFKDCALGAYRALLQTNGLDCLGLLPDVLITGDPQDSSFRRSLAYLLRLTVDRFGVSSFEHGIRAVIGNLERPVWEICAVTLRLEDYLTNELGRHSGVAHGRMSEYMREVWTNGVSSISQMSPEQQTAVFDLIVDLCGEPRTAPDFFRGDIKTVLIFGGIQELAIRQEDRVLVEHCRVYWEPEEVYLEASLAAAH